MKQFPLCRVPLIALVISIGTAGAQTLSDVLCSVQERKQVLEQAQAFVRDMDESPNVCYPNGVAGSFELISWSGVAAYPEDEDLADLGIEVRVRLLNEARRHFQAIRAGFVNVAPERINGTEGAGPPAVIRRFDELSLPTPPVADHMNYLSVLRELACKVAALRVTPWPVSYTHTTGTIDNSNPDRSQTTGADKIKWSEINQNGTVIRDFWAPERPVIASFCVGGKSHEARTGTEGNYAWHPEEYRYARREWPSAFTLSYVPEATLPTGVPAVQGTCVVLVGQHNSPYLPASGTGTSATPIPPEGGYTILASRAAAGSQAITAPEWVVSGSWVSSGTADEQTRNKMEFKPTLATASRYDLFFSSGGNEYKYTCVEQEIVFLLLPSFLKGLDKQDTEGQTTDFLWDRPRSPGMPGAVAVSGGAAKLSVDVGRGESMGVSAAIQLQHCWTEFPAIFTTGGGVAAPYSYPKVLWAHPNASTEYLDYFTDKANHRRMPLSFATQLKFVGPERDYQVLYETRFDHGRASLNDWPVTSLLDGNYGWQHGMAYYWEWQKPRLRQVLGREALIDVVTGNNDYTHTISVYRIPVGEDLDYDDDGFVVVAGLPLVKTVTLGNPTMGEGDFPIADLELDVEADGGVWAVAGTSSDLVGALDYPTDWSVSLLDSETSAVLLEEQWSSAVDYANVDPVTSNYTMTALEAPITSSTVVVRTMDEEAGTETTQTITFDSLRSLCADPLPRISNVLVEGSGGTANTEMEYASGAGAPEFPVTITSTVENEPEIVTQLDTSGLPASVTRGAGASQWKAEWDILADGRFVEETKLGGAVYGRNWTKWENGGHVVTTYSAPDGYAVDPDDPEVVAWTKLETGRIGGNGFPGLPHKLERGDGTGATWAWTVNAGGSSAVEMLEGLLSGASVTRGTKITAATNSQGYLTGTERFLVHDNSIKVSGSSVPSGEFTTWGAPKKFTDFNSGLASSVSYDGNRDRAAGVTDTLGVATQSLSYDALGRLDSFIWNGSNGTATYNSGGFGASSTIEIPDRTVSRSNSFDALGRPTAGSLTAGGTSSFTMAHLATGKTVAATDFVTGATSTTKLRPADGSLEEQTGNILPFGGVDGSTLTVDSGLLKTTTELGGQEAAWRKAWADAWGRPRETETPSTAATGTDATTWLYSDADSPLNRVCITDAAGRKLITESDPYNASGAIRRSGIDMDQNGSLGSADRYVESITTVSNDGKLVTTLSRTENTGLREILRTEWTPAGNQTVIKINVNEETITRTPHYDTTPKTVGVSSTRGWSGTETLNSLGLTETSTLGGTGIPTTTLDPTWRGDGSLGSVSFDVGGKTHSASFKDDGTLASLIVPGRGNILGGHTFATENGVRKEILTIDDATFTCSLDGTERTTSGNDVPGKTEALTISGNGFKDTTTPVVGAPTEVVMNSAGAPTAKNYAAGNGEGYLHGKGGLLNSVTLARGGSLAFAYSEDGAKDLISAAWPVMPSTTFTEIPAVSLVFGHDLAGRVDAITDPSGARSLAYQNSSLKETHWSSGTLAGYKLVRELATDGSGRDIGFTLYLGNAVVHSVQKTPDGDSDQISALACGNLIVKPQRDAAGNITGYQWGPDANPFVPTVTQNWQRGPGGRIEAAGSNVTGAPSFDYLIDGELDSYSFDTKGRRLKCATAGGEWTYAYTNGQLTSATHPTLGTFAYQFDGIGRRTNMGELTANDALNRTLAWTHSQAKTLNIKTTSGTDVHIEIGPETEDITGFSGSATRQVPIPGAGGGWVPWSVLATLDDQGEGAGNPPPNALASPDAKAQQNGAVWVPPINESFDFDAAGNRESSALWDYGWDGRDKLVRARTKNHDTSARGHDITFSYDAEGRRLKKNVNTYQNGSIVSQNRITFIWDGWDLIYERHQNPSGLTTLERKYVWGPDISGSHDGAGGAGGLLLIRETRGAQTKDYYPLYDGGGHVIALADSNGTLVAEYAYGPFGELIHAKGPMAQINPIRYATKYFDSEMGLYYFGQRYLDPITGQWLSRELLGEDESLNLYAYCGNDPVNGIDRLGLENVAGYQKGISNANMDSVTANYCHWLGKTKLDEDVSRWTAIFNTARKSGARIDPKLIEAVLWLNASGHGANDLRLAYSQAESSARIDVANAGIDRIYRQSTFMDWAGCNAPGTIDPNIDPDYFDDANPQFRSDEWTRRFLKVNPATEIARQAVHGNYGQAAKEFGKEVALWSTFCIGGEFLSVGKVGFSVAGAGTGGGGSRVFTITDDFGEICSSGRIWGQTEGSVYGMRVTNAPRWRTMANVPSRDPGMIVFEGQAAALFRSHPVEGIYSGLKRVLGQQKAGFGDIVFDTATATTSGNTLVIRNAYLGVHAGQSSAMAAARLWGRRLGIDIPITAASGYWIYEAMNGDTP